MIGKLLNGVLKLVIGLTSTLLAPIDTMIEQALPSLADGLNAVNSMIDWVVGIIGFVVDASGLTSVAILLIIGYWTFSITSTLTLYLVKLALKWYRMLMP